MAKDAAKKDFMRQLNAYDDAVNDLKNPHEDVIRITHSPSVNFALGNGHGLPRGYTLLAYGPNKGGKSIMCYDTIGALHQDSETAFAVRWDTELREQLQLPPGREKAYGIDRKRYKCYATNKPEDIFDRFETDINAMCTQGLDLRLAIIDSTSMIQGYREVERETQNSFQIGDQARTLQAGLKHILPVIRKHGIALILVTHLRAELDINQVRRGNTVKPQSGWAMKHFAEYFAYVDRDDTAAGKTDLSGNAFVDSSRLDVRKEGKGEVTGHRVRFLVKESSAGPRNRMGIFNFNYFKGIQGTHEEVFMLGKNRGIIKTPEKGNGYLYGDKKWGGEAAALEGLAADPGIQKAILDELRQRDMSGEWALEDVAAPEGIPEIDELLSQ